MTRADRLVLTSAPRTSGSARATTKGGRDEGRGLCLRAQRLERGISQYL